MLDEERVGSPAVIIRKFRWQCLVCGYRWEKTGGAKGSDGLPLTCPRCHSPNWATGPKYRWDRRKREALQAERKGLLLTVTPLELEGEAGKADRDEES